MTSFVSASRKLVATLLPQRTEAAQQKAERRLFELCLGFSKTPVADISEADNADRMGYNEACIQAITQNVQTQHGAAIETVHAALAEAGRALPWVVECESILVALWGPSVAGSRSFDALRAEACGSERKQPVCGASAFSVSAAHDLASSLLAECAAAAGADPISGAIAAEMSCIARAGSPGDVFALARVLEGARPLFARAGPPNTRLLTHMMERARRIGGGIPLRLFWAGLRMFARLVHLRLTGRLGELDVPELFPCGRSLAFVAGLLALLRAELGPLDARRLALEEGLKHTAGVLTRVPEDFRAIVRRESAPAEPSEAYTAELARVLLAQWAGAFPPAHGDRRIWGRAVSQREWDDEIIKTAEEAEKRRRHELRAGLEAQRWQRLAATRSQEELETVSLVDLMHREVKARPQLTSSTRLDAIRKELVAKYNLMIAEEEHRRRRAERELRRLNGLPASSDTPDDLEALSPSTPDRPAAHDAGEVPPPVVVPRERTMEPSSSGADAPEVPPPLVAGDASSEDVSSDASTPPETPLQVSSESPEPPATATSSSAPDSSASIEPSGAADAPEPPSAHEEQLIDAVPVVQNAAVHAIMTPVAATQRLVSTAFLSWLVSCRHSLPAQLRALRDVMFLWSPEVQEEFGRRPLAPTDSPSVRLSREAGERYGSYFGVVRAPESPLPDVFKERCTVEFRPHAPVSAFFAGLGFSDCFRLFRTLARHQAQLQPIWTSAMAQARTRATYDRRLRGLLIIRHRMFVFISVLQRFFCYAVEAQWARLLARVSQAIRRADVEELRLAIGGFHREVVARLLLDAQGAELLAACGLCVRGVGRFADMASEWMDVSEAAQALPAADADADTPQHGEEERKRRVALLEDRAFGLFCAAKEAAGAFDRSLLQLRAALSRAIAGGRHDLESLEFGLG